MDRVAPGHCGAGSATGRPCRRSTPPPLRQRCNRRSTGVHGRSTDASPTSNKRLRRGCRRSIVMRNQTLQKAGAAMEYGSIERVVHIDASPEVVFEVVSSPEHLREWWPDEADIEPVPGAVGQLI